MKSNSMGSLLFVLILTAVFLAGMAGERVLMLSSESTLSDAAIFPQAFAQGGTLEELPEVVEKVVPAVVNLSSKKVVSFKGRQMPSFFDDPFFRRFFGDEFFRRYDVPRERIERNLGSGVIVSEDGYILTSNHLVEKAEEVEIFLPDEREFDARIVGVDPKSDVAVLKIDAEGLPTVPLGSSKELRLAQTVLAVGYPFGIGQTVTMGIVSALGRANLNLVEYEDFIQTDAAINPGNSGGALINTKGELIGINTAILSSTGRYQGVGFAIPIDLAYSVMENIIEHGRVIRGYLGVLPQEMDPQMARAFDMDDASGIIISDVMKDSPADKGGLKRGDVVLSYRGEEIEGVNEFRQVVAMTAPGKEVEIEIQRDGKRKKLNIAVGEFPDDGESTEVTKQEVGSPLFLDVGLESLDDYHRRELDIPKDIKGVIVTSVDRNSSAAESGLAEGDVILEVNRKRIKNLKDFNELTEKSEAERVLLLVYRNGNTIYLLIKP